MWEQIQGNLLSDQSMCESGVWCDKPFWGGFLRLTLFLTKSDQAKNEVPSEVRPLEVVPGVPGL